MVTELLYSCAILFLHFYTLKLAAKRYYSYLFFWIVGWAAYFHVCDSLRLAASHYRFIMVLNATINW